MQLWTDYEGVTIDGAFPLKKLLKPEGRSAFFSTTGTNGEPTVVRLIECHFDEEEILARWRSIDALSHPNFLKFERYGQTEVDGRPVVYAVFEKVDGNLAEVLDQGHLAVKDVADLALSLVAALEVLHTHGFVHEHIEPSNIFAKNSVVKLRGDCIREAPEGEEGRMAKRRDVRELATVLLQGLTQRRSLEGVPDSAMPAPFGQIIRKGMDGTWGLENIRAVLKEHFGSKPSAPLKPAEAAAAKKAAVVQKAATVATKPVLREEAPRPVVDEARSGGFARAAERKDLRGAEAESGDQSFWMSNRWLSAGAVALVLLICIWVVAHAWNAHGHKAAEAGSGSQQAATGPAATGQAGQQIASSAAPAAVAGDVPPAGQATAAESHAGWRVITFTYSRRADAEKKVSDIAHTHPDLEPTVFTPTGHTPYLVSIGGVMDRDAARALVRRARSLRLPRDTYAQNYSH